MSKIDRRTLLEMFEQMDASAGEPTELCVIGAAAFILIGMPMRQTGDIDVWRPASSINDAKLRRIAASAGLDVDPEAEDPDRPYLQIVSPGIVNLPESRGENWPARQRRIVLWQGSKLTVSCPPLSVLAAAKLVRASDIDLNDVVYLINARRVRRHHIEQALKAFPEADQEQAGENLDLLEVIASGKRQRNRSRDRGGEDR